MLRMKNEGLTDPEIATTGAWHSKPYTFSTTGSRQIDTHAPDCLGVFWPWSVGLSWPWSADLWVITMIRSSIIAPFKKKHDLIDGGPRGPTLGWPCYDDLRSQHSKHSLNETLYSPDIKRTLQHSLLQTSKHVSLIGNSKGYMYSN